MIDIQFLFLILSCLPALLCKFIYVRLGHKTMVCSVCCYVDICGILIQNFDMGMYQNQDAKSFEEMCYQMSLNGLYIYIFFYSFHIVLVLIMACHHPDQYLNT